MKWIKDVQFHFNASQREGVMSTSENWIISVFSIVLVLACILASMVIWDKCIRNCKLLSTRRQTYGPLPVYNMENGTITNAETYVAPPMDTALDKTLLVDYNGFL